MHLMLTRAWVEAWSIADTDCEVLDSMSSKATAMFSQMQEGIKVKVSIQDLYISMKDLVEDYIIDRLYMFLINITSVDWVV